VWSDIIDLIPGVRHFAIDLPGHGNSRPFEVQDDLPGLGRLIAAVARDLDAHIMVAMSFGGLLALESAIQLPEQFHTLILASPSLGGGPQDAQAQAANVDLQSLNRVHGPGPWLADRWMAVPPQIFAGLRRFPIGFERLAAVVARHAWAELAQPVMERLASTDQVGRLHRIRAQTHLLVGEDDMVSFKRSAELIRRAIQGAVRHYIEDSGHLCLLERPQEGADVLRSILGAAAESAAGSSQRDEVGARGH